jgi:hypothetical protein
VASLRRVAVRSVRTDEDRRRAVRSRVIRSALLAGVFVAASSTVVLGQYEGPTGAAPSKAPFDPRDLSGVWAGGLKVGKVPPMLPAAQTKFDENTIELKRGLPLTKDPVLTCHPAGIPHAYQNGVYSIEIVQTPSRVFMFFESAHLWRPIWIDGRDMPKDSEPLWMGYSVGRWEGNELVVETAHFNDRTWLDNAGHPHSEALRVTERFRRVDRNTLQIDITINDPLSYTAPWTMTANYQLRPTWEITEAFCVLDDQTNFYDVILAPNAKP